MDTLWGVLHRSMFQEGFFKSPHWAWGGSRPAVEENVLSSNNLLRLQVLCMEGYRVHGVDSFVFLLSISLKFPDAILGSAVALTA